MKERRKGEKENIMKRIYERKKHNRKQKQK